jgi:hypothetical protein
MRDVPYAGVREKVRRGVCSGEGGSEEEGCIQGQGKEWRGIYAGVEEGVRREVCISDSGSE